MKYAKEQRLDIGRQIYEGKLSRYEAGEKFNISDQTARDYMRLYRDANSLPPKSSVRSNTITAKSAQTAPSGLEDLEAMSKEERIKEIIKSKAKRYRYRKPGEPLRTFPNLLLIPNS